MVPSLGHSSPCRSLLLAAWFASILANKVSAQLVGCDVLGCRADGCTVGNVTNSFIGTTSFNTSASPAGSLTWTVGASTLASSSNSTQVQFVKSFYLGYPSSLDLTSTSDLVGCALFFEGIAKSITLNGTSEIGSVTCDQTLGDGCVRDLLVQAQQQIQALSKGSDDDDDNKSVCLALQAALESQPPPSCQATATVTWGDVVAKDITGARATLDPIKQTSCHPSTGGAGYEIALIETQKVTSEEVSSDNAPFFFSMTPVMTIFHAASGAEGQSRALPETHLSCLKVVEDSSLSQPATNVAAIPLPESAHLLAMLLLIVSAVALV